jgi:hypothetical protein
MEPRDLRRVLIGATVFPRSTVRLLRLSRWVVWLPMADPARRCLDESVDLRLGHTSRIKAARVAPAVEPVLGLGSVMSSLSLQLPESLGCHRMRN